jgi:hypothetical protein
VIFWVAAGTDIIINMQESVERLKAKEMKTTPRIVITAESVMIFSPKGKKLKFDINAMGHINQLIRVLADQKNRMRLSSPKPS